MELAATLSFLGAAILLTLMPGPDNIFVLTESLTKGQRNGFAISVGLCSGVLVHTLAAATGVSIIIQKSALAFSVVKYLGAAYLFYMAYQAYNEKRLEIEVKRKPVEHETSFLKLARKGFLMNVLNPKVALFFMALLPQFVVTDGFSVTVQMIILGIIFMLQGLVIFGLISLLSGKLSKYLNSARFWKITKYGKVSVLALLGLGLAMARK
ncbi:Threonine/homoserine/homoserine lactone efflux protein [Saccharicrinis carchari]|uniref:Threonine/homoserine/homoserine lactone efflux protein n=1 Tax=Saccharicrinis carchari TaxID=1168039 RepID=A0A521DHA3_SACCC|nr:LysE family translocator [Saccharicrinis carchari]SMO71008.1 Threonine/homoserine/homoserine lactone efflux protein [Saccharicrinis carchari]